MSSPAEGQIDHEFDLASYTQRIGYDARARVDRDTLTDVHRAHVSAIPFENLDIQLGGRIKLDLASLQAKMVRRRRGGYCFEHNTLFAAALRALGFAPRICEARVREGARGAVRARTHMLLLVDCDGATWLADVGFGGDGLCEPVRADGTVSQQAVGAYRVTSEPPLLVLQRAQAAGWEDVYAFNPTPVHPIDIEMANWFTSTHPESSFVRTLTAQCIIGDTRHILRNLTHLVSTGSGTTTDQIARSALVPVLRNTFGIDVPDDALFSALDGRT